MSNTLDFITSPLNGYPVTIGENCRIENSFVGPYSSIADRAVLSDADIEHSVILQDSKIEGVQERIVDSLIGERVQLKAAPKRPKALRFMVGDDSTIELTGV